MSACHSSRAGLVVIVVFTNQNAPTGIHCLKAAVMFQRGHFRESFVHNSSSNLEVAMLRFLAFVLLFAVPVFASDVIELNDENFESEMKDKDMALVEFFAPW